MDATAQSRRVVVVEDDDDLREVEVGVLCRAGLDAHGYPRAEQAIDAIAHGARPLALLVDVRLPGMSGDELAAALRKHPGTATIPILAVTGDATQLENPIGVWDGVLLKPIDPHALVRAVRRAIADAR